MLTREQQTLTQSGCDVRFDNLTRQLHATDASIYQVVPRAVAFPRDAGEASAVVRAAAEISLPVIPRGAGTGLAGGAIGEGLILELARHRRRITALDRERHTVRVEPGVVLDQLNAFLKPHGYRFGPDVATSSRATLGGMIANNSSGSHVPVYGTTADHLQSLDILLADGSIHTIGPDSSALPEQHGRVTALLKKHAREIGRRQPPGLAKRWPGYGLDRWLRHQGQLQYILSGSEGTLAAIVSAELKIVPLPQQKGLGLLFFHSVAEAMQATVELLDLRPAAIEHIDRLLFDQTRGQLAFREARDLMELDGRPCESILLVEFFEDVDDRLAALEKRKLGHRKLILTDPIQMEKVWRLRKAGLSLLAGCPGAAKPTTGIEDAAIAPEALPEYVAGLQSILTSLDLEACFYGHAAAGLLHVRPVLDLQQPGDREKFRQVGQEVSALVRQFKGSLAGEHGVGMARTEFMREQMGDTLMGVLQEIKNAFDPANLFNPGKIVGNNTYRIDTHLRMGASHERAVPFDPVLAFAAKDHSFMGNLEQCNGCGGCRKDVPTMCPTFAVTGEEIMSTRGRANTIRAVLDGRAGNPSDPLASEELEAALSDCLSCKACTAECPSNVNLALLKAELTHARHQRHGVSWRERMISHADTLGRLGCLAPDLANAALNHSWLRRLTSRILGFAADRPLPPFAEERFDCWFQQHKARSTNKRGRVLLWDDTFVRYHEPHIGKAAVAVLEHAGFEVQLVTQRQCCGRPAFSQGCLDEAARLGRHNLDLLRDDTAPVLFLEPSCWSMFTEDYRELNLPGAAKVGRRSFLFEQFIHQLLVREPDALSFRNLDADIAVHVHCHTKSLVNPGFMTALFDRIPGARVALLKTGCCGMAGAFGMMADKYELSKQVADPLVQLVNNTNAIVTASGTSCRHQIEHLATARARHAAELLAGAIGEA